jgi:Flp pilus assembly protein TadD
VVVLVSRTRYSEATVVRGVRRAFFVALLLALSVPLYADRHSDAQAQVAFGIDVAHKGLWREAILRWKKAIELDKTYAEAWNDLAIGYEQMGMFPEARDAYDTALKIEPTNEYIRQNYDAFREIYDRQNRRGGR